MKLRPGVVPPVPQQPRLHVLDGKRCLEQRVVEEINLADRQIVRGAPVGIHLREQVGRERFVQVVFAVGGATTQPPRVIGIGQPVCHRQVSKEPYGANPGRRLGSAKHTAHRPGREVASCL